MLTEHFYYVLFYKTTKNNKTQTLWERKVLILMGKLWFCLLQVIIPPNGDNLNNSNIIRVVCKNAF